MPVPAERVGRLILVRTAAAADLTAGVVVYARVSSHDQRWDLDRQVARLNGTRPKLARVLSDPDARVIVVKHRDRLARFGVEHLEAALSGQGRRIVIADPGEATDDLVRDIIDVLTSMCARLYGRRGARNGAMRAITATRRDPGEAP